MTNNAPRFPLLSTLLLIVLTGAALAVAEGIDNKMGLSSGQKILAVSLLGASVCAWLTSLSQHHNNSIWLTSALKSGFVIAVIVAMWAFWPVVNDLLFK